MLVNVEGIDEVTLTTNGLLLEEQASDLFHAGLSRLNVSLDSLDEKHLSRWLDSTDCRRYFAELRPHKNRISDNTNKCCFDCKSDRTRSCAVGKVCSTAGSYVAVHRIYAA